MAINLIAAHDRNRLIGSNNQLPWSLPEDLQYFKRVTEGNVIVMGRSTFESIGIPLPNRENIILTRNEGYLAKGCTVVTSLAQLQSIIDVHIDDDKEIFVVGGSQIYSLFLPFAENLFITEIDHAFQGNAYFPEYNKSEWNLIGEQRGDKNAENPYNYSFKIYTREVDK